MEELNRVIVLKLEVEEAIIGKIPFHIIPISHSHFTFPFHIPISHFPFHIMIFYNFFYTFYIIFM